MSVPRLPVGTTPRVRTVSQRSGARVRQVTQDQDVTRVCTLSTCFIYNKL